METETVLITPELARQFLDRNIHHNRPLRPSFVRHLAGAISRGEWELTHQGIAFDKKGNLVDGQHRLQAVISAGQSVPMRVTTGAAWSWAVDRGGVKSLSDLLQIDQRVGVALKTLCQVVTKNSNPTAKQLHEFSLGFLTPAESVCGALKARRRFVGRGAVLAAATLRVALGHSPEYVFDVCQILNELRFSEMPPIVEAFYRQISTGVNKDYPMFLRAWVALDAEKQNSSVLRIVDPVAMMTDVRSRAKKYMKAQREQ